MKTSHSICRVLYWYPCFLWIIITVTLIWMPVCASAQQIVATIVELNGTVTVSIQGGTPIAAQRGMTLSTGDVIDTQTGASVVLTLTEGSELRLGQNTKIDLAALSQRPSTGARTSRLKLLYGQIRALLSPGHQQEGSSFTIETPNAEAGVKFSQPIIEASYDPNTETSVFKAYSVALTITNHATGEIKQVPQGSEVIIQKEFILISSISKVAPTRNIVIQHAKSVVRGATSTSVPISVGTGGTGEGTAITETSTNPSPGVRPGTPDKRYHPVTISIHEY